MSEPEASLTDDRQIEIGIHNSQTYLKLDPNWVDRVVRTTLSAMAVGQASISVTIVDNASIRDINARYLKHDWETDVISFPLSDDGAAELAGELIISAEMAYNTAQEVHCDPLQEVALYLVHGLLHLCGYQDYSVEDVAVIRGLEAEALKSLGIVNSYHLVDQIPLVTDESSRESVRWPR